MFGNNRMNGMGRGMGRGGRCGRGGNGMQGAGFGMGAGRGMGRGMGMGLMRRDGSCMTGQFPDQAINEEAARNRIEVLEEEARRLKEMLKKD